MKMKLLAMSVATIVAICSLGAKALAQDATPEQIAAEQERLRITAELNAAWKKQAQERMSLMTPEQLMIYTNRLEKIKKLPLPPMPSNAMVTARKKLLSGTTASMSMQTLAVQQPTFNRRDYLEMRAVLVDKFYAETADIDLANTLNQTLATNDTATLNLFVQENLNLSDLVSGNTNIVVYSITAEDYVPLNTLPFNTGWTTKNTQGYSPWFTVNRTLVPTNGPAARSAVSLAAGYKSTIETTLYNHYDYWADPVDSHTLGLWYQLLNKYAGDWCQLQLGPSGAYWLTDLSASTSWKNVQYSFGTIPKATTSLQFAMVVYSQNGSPIASYLDPSVRWKPSAAYYPVNEDFVIEIVGNQVWVSWWAAVYRPSHWFLTFATSIQGPWSSSIGVPVSTVNSVSTAKFNIITGGGMRFYRLNHY